MSKLTTFMGTACVIATTALAASPAAADTLTDFAGNLSTAYTNTNFDVAGSDNENGWFVGGVLGGPLSDLANLNFQVDASYTHNWADHFSQEVWTFGGDAFWAGPEGRIGLDGHYTNANQVGHLTNGGAFGEWYFGPFTAMAKGGWLSPGGSGFGGHGNYLGAGVVFYVMPDLSLTGGIDYVDLVQGHGCQVCGRTDAIQTSYQILAEFLVAEDLGISGFGGYSYVHHSDSGFSSHDNVWMVGLRWYISGGTLIDHHRNGNLNPWLTGP
jgi:hypothetical protein